MTARYAQITCEKRTTRCALEARAGGSVVKAAGFVAAQVGDD